LAMADEREQCAKEAESYGDGGSPLDPLERCAVRTISAAIRALDPRR
jgi:hypothetical protein